MKKLHFYLIIAIFTSVIFMSCTKAEAMGNEEVKTSSPAASTQSKTQENDKDQLMFSTKDIDGNTVTHEIFGKYDITLINIWGTFCGPCRAELPDLEAAYKAYADKKVNVIALTADLQENDKETLNFAKELWKDAGCSFKALVTVDSFLPIYQQITGVPTSFIVDKNGRLIPGTIHTGRLNKAGFEKLFETALKTVGSK